jgi:ubiquinone/menaquinone biosynthesis C-methylase UbiE
MKDSFDSYSENYSRVIAEGARASGETYEYMVELRAAYFRNETSEMLDVIRNPHILDFGCGTGYTIEVISRYFPHAKLVGFDSSKDSIALAQRRNIQKAGFEFGVKCPLPFEDNTFDAIFSNGTFHHITDRERMQWMKELVRTLKRNGVLVVFENNPLNPLMMQSMRRTPFDANAEPVKSGRLAALMRNSGLKPSCAHYYFFFPHALRWCRGVEPLLKNVPLGAQYFVKALKEH